MSLRAFHLLFISLSVILAAFSAAWAVGQYRLEHEPIYAVTTAGVDRQRGRPDVVRNGLSTKDQESLMRRIITTALIVGVPRAALACPVCFGQS